MNISFRTVTNTQDEKSMGQKYWFSPAPDCDAISATANAPGFTPLIAIARHFAWDYQLLEKAAGQCNTRGEVAIVALTGPSLFLVPATKGHGEAQFLIKDLLKAVAAVGATSLHFTHFGFLQGKFPEAEVSSVLRELLGPNVPRRLEKIVFDIDVRAERKLYDLMRPKT